MHEYPKDFKWGAATASYQIEGAYNEDGRGLSVWDEFSRRPGTIRNNDNGDIACDHYHRYREDIAIMKQMGLNAYRFSFAWSRILPEGKGKINPKGIDFYNRLIDGLLEAGIEPFATAFHWDLPLALEKDHGGFRNKEIARYFADYCALLSGKFSDRVSHWATTNEIRCFTEWAMQLPRWNQNGIAQFAPGTFDSPKIANQAVHNALLAHGTGVRAIRENAVKPVSVGIAENSSFFWPVYESPENIAAAKKAFIRNNQSILFPIFTGKYSPEFIRSKGADMADFTDEEMKIIGTKIDWLGYNQYYGTPVRASNNEAEFEIVSQPADFPRNNMGWDISPKAFYWMLLFSKELLGNIPIYITENGYPADDVETESGEILDLGRIEYMRQHLEMGSRAIQDGANLKGYFAWTLLDNFEWAYGYSKRFGLVRVNYATQARTVKLSGKYYADVIKANRVL